MSALSAEEIERYARHLILPEIGGAGQQKLKAARVLVIGAGGLGAAVLHYLAAAGIGVIGIVDDDQVSLSNLQRQVIHSSDSIGHAKVDSAARAISALNPHIMVETHQTRFNAANAMALIGAYDLVMDGTDNFAARYLISDACFLARKPLVTAALGRFDATVTTLAPHLADAQGQPNPTYRCLYPKAPSAGTVPSCAEAGILGVVAGIAGTLQALEAIKMITDAGTPLIGRLLMIDALATRFDTIRYGRDPNNPLNGDKPRYRDLSHHDLD